VLHEVLLHGLPRGGAGAACSARIALLLEGMPRRVAPGAAGLASDKALPAVWTARQKACPGYGRQAPGEAGKGGEGSRGGAREIVEIRAVAPGAQGTVGRGEIPVAPASRAGPLSRAPLGAAASDTSTQTSPASDRGSNLSAPMATRGRRGTPALQ